MGGEIDPDEICVNCYRKISGRETRCPFCGKVWWRIEANGSDSDEKGEE